MLLLCFKLSIPIVMKPNLLCGEVESQEVGGFLDDLSLVLLHVLEPDEL